MPNRYAEASFRHGKLQALIALVDALDEEKLPRERGKSFKAGGIEQFFDLDSPLQPRALLTVLREAGVPHDNNWRFRPLVIYENLPHLRNLHRQYIGGIRIMSLQVDQETDSEVEETGAVEEETSMDEKEENGDQVVAEAQGGPSEARNKPRVPPGLVSFFGNRYRT